MGHAKFDRPLIARQTTRFVTDVTAYAIKPEVTITPAGHAMPVSWAPVAGASEAEVTSAFVEITPTRQAVIESVQSTPKDGTYELSIPAHKRVRSIDLSSLRWVHTVHNEEIKTPLRSSSDMGGEIRLTVSIPDTQNQMTTVYTVPSVGGHHGVPAMFRGAALSNAVLSVPEIDARKVRIGLVTDERPEDWNARTVELASSVGASLLTLATDLSLLGLDGQEVWAFPGEFTTSTPKATADLRASIEASFTTALKEQRPLAGQITLKATNTAPVGIQFSEPQGALIRRIAKVPTITLEGDPVIAPFTVAPEVALASEQPASAIASVSVKYAGIRLLESVQPTAPDAANVRGVVVRAEPIQSALPPAALKDRKVARVGLIGRAAEACEISVQFVDARTSPPRPLGPPGVLRIDAGENTIRTVWVEMPDIDTEDAPVTVSVRATRGRFFWCTNEQPLVRIAIHDPDPGARPIRLGDAPIFNVTTEKVAFPSVSLTTSAFRNATQIFDSELFVTIDVADVVLRYAR